MEGLTKAVCDKITDDSWGSKRYITLVDKIVQSIKDDITRSVIKNRVIQNSELIAKIDKKVEDAVQKIITTTIGRMIFQELMKKEEPGEV